MSRQWLGAFLVALGMGCGSSGGCSGITPLPTDPAPLGFPRDQLIEGGIQARITDQTTIFTPGFSQASTAQDSVSERPAWSRSLRRT